MLLRCDDNPARLQETTRNCDKIIIEKLRYFGMESTVSLGQGSMLHQPYGRIQ